MIQKTLRTYSPKSRRRKFVIDENLYTYSSNIEIDFPRKNLDWIFLRSSPWSRVTPPVSSFQVLLILSNWSNAGFPTKAFHPQQEGCSPKKWANYRNRPLTPLLLYSSTLFLSLSSLSLSLFSVQMSRRSTTKQDIRFAAIDFPQLFTVAQDEFGNRYRIDGFLSDLEKRKTALEILESSSSTCLSRPGWKFGRLFAKYSERCRASNRVL